MVVSDRACALPYKGRADRRTAAVSSTDELARRAGVGRGAPDRASAIDMLRRWPPVIVSDL